MPPAGAGEAAVEAEEEGPFEIRDFSVASPWEELISTVEEAVRAWLRGAPDSCGFQQLRHGRRDLLLSCHGEPHEQSAPPDGALPRFMREMLDADADFRAGESFSKDAVERLRRWFGLQTFVLLQPATPESLDASEMALLQGTLNVALLNCGCAMPGFVSHEPARGGFCGRASGDGGATRASLGCRFDVDCFAPVPAHVQELDGLLRLFRDKVCAGDAPPLPMGEVAISARHTLLLPRWPESNGCPGRVPGTNARDEPPSRPRAHTCLEAALVARVEAAGCNPYVSHAATLRIPRCNPTSPTLQPYVSHHPGGGPSGGRCGSASRRSIWRRAARQTLCRRSR